MASYGVSIVIISRKYMSKLHIMYKPMFSEL